ncbi:MAG: hypothetical protein KAS96_09675 [Planctomycetes bacterium]|nr:hypothetical protein [Planctomycetota bacterium]
MKLNSKVFSVPKLSGPIFNSSSNSDLESPEKYCCPSFCADKCQESYVTLAIAITLSADV